MHDLASIGGSVVEFSPATRETGVRFPDGEISLFSLLFFTAVFFWRGNFWTRKHTPNDAFTSIGGSVVEFSPATREAWVRFPANARQPSAYVKFGNLGIWNSVCKEIKKKICVCWNSKKEEFLEKCRFVE